MYMELDFTELPGFHDEVRNEQWFLKLRWEISGIISWIIQEILEPTFKASTHLNIWNDIHWERIYEIISQSQKVLPLEKHEFPLEKRFINHMYLMFWDENIVSLMCLLVSSWIISLASNPYEGMFNEMEAKFMDVSEKKIHDIIMWQWWKERYKGILVDDYFSFWKNDLEKDGKRQLRIREKIFHDMSTKEVLTCKRKPSTHSDEYKHLIWNMSNTIEKDINPEEMKKHMKLLLEMEFTIHDEEWFREIMNILSIYMTRTKIKHRNAYTFKWWKVELEKYFWSKIPYFVEIEAWNGDLMNLIISKLELTNSPCLVTGSMGVFEYYNLQDDYIVYPQDSIQGNNFSMQERFLLRKKWVNKMNSWEFDFNS